MIAIEASSGCCPECLAELPEHWLTDLFRYCPHRRVMSQCAPDGRWHVMRPVPAFLIRFVLWRLRRRMAREARAAGLSVAELDRLLQWNRATSKRT